MFLYTFKFLFETCRLPSSWPTKMKLCPTFRHLWALNLHPGVHILSCLAFL